MGRLRKSVEIHPEKLKMARKWRGLTQAHLAAMVGYSPSRIAQVEIGHENRLPMESLALISSILGVPMMELVTEVEKRRVADVDQC